PNLDSTLVILGLKFGPSEAEAGHFLKFNRVWLENLSPHFSQP
ncbi:34508_t:CDS:1, partial [Gigaspora margarita]